MSEHCHAFGRSPFLSPVFEEYAGARAPSDQLILSLTFENVADQGLQSLGAPWFLIEKGVRMIRRLGVLHESRLFEPSFVRIFMKSSAIVCLKSESSLRALLNCLRL